MNITNLILQLQSIQSDSTLDQQAISKAIKLLEVGAVITVASFANLPSASLNLGKLYYVEFDGLYFSDGITWQSVNPPTTLAWTWGRNITGIALLGDGTEIDRSSPVRVVGGFTDWCQVSASRFHTAAIRIRGRGLWGWGSNSSGRLGVGSGGGFTATPVPVAGGFTDWCQVSAAKAQLGTFVESAHTVALRTNGTLWAWGAGYFGQLGIGFSIQSATSPRAVVGGFTDWCQVSAGGNHTAAVRTNGTLWAWGNACHGKLGDGQVVSNRTSPVSVVGGFTDWCQVSAGAYHTAALRTNGTLWAWGLNDSGQLGDNTIINKSSPVSVVGGFTNWCQVSAGDRHTAALRTIGTLWTWGSGSGGRLGDGTGIGRSSPVNVIGGFTDWCQINAGVHHTAAVRQNGTLWTWGCNGAGQLGDNTIINKSSPISVIGGFTDWCQVSAGQDHTVALRAIPKGF
jgi:alpha-tubulin suppressor-like RCC1 family protein